MHHLYRQFEFRRFVYEVPDKPTFDECKQEAGKIEKAPNLTTRKELKKLADSCTVHLGSRKIDSVTEKVDSSHGKAPYDRPLDRREHMPSDSEINPDDKEQLAYIKERLKNEFDERVEKNQRFMKFKTETWQEYSEIRKNLVDCAVSEAIVSNRTQEELESIFDDVVDELLKRFENGAASELVKEKPNLKSYFVKLQLPERNANRFIGNRVLDVHYKPEMFGEMSKILMHRLDQVKDQKGVWLLGGFDDDEVHAKAARLYQYVQFPMMLESFLNDGIIKSPKISNVANVQAEKIMAIQTLYDDFDRYVRQRLDGTVRGGEPPIDWNKAP